VPGTASEWLPLTPAQQGLFFAQQLDPGSPAYTTAEVVELQGELDERRLEAAIRLAYEEFEQLRTEFRLTSDGPRQRVRETTAVRFELAEADTPETANALIEAAIERPLDLLRGETTRTGLIRLPEERTWWWHAAHHVVCDGYAAQQLLRRVAEYFAGGGDAETGAGIPLAALVAEDHRAPGSEAFWDERLARMSGPASLAGRTLQPAPRAIRCGIDLDEDLQRLIVGGARALRSSWTDLVIAAAGSYVARYAGADAGRIGLPLMNRALPRVGSLLSARTVCTAMNVLPAVIPSTGTVREVLAVTRAEQQALREHPFERQEWLSRRLARRASADLFGMQVNLIPLELELVVGTAAGTVRNITAGPVEDLTLTVRGTPGRGRRVRLELDAHPGLYDAAALDLHLARLRHWIMVWATAEGTASVAEFELLPGEERARATSGSDGARVDRLPLSLGRRFLDQALRTPDAVALRSGGASRSYAELLAGARRIACGLRAKGVGPGDVVGIRLPRGFELFEAVYAVALLGAVYLPVDPELPGSRIEMMIEDASAVTVVDETESLRAAGSWLGDPPDDVDAPAYLIFTSGSTGRPKGVLVSHRAIDNRLAWMQHRFALALGERVLHKTPISFDVSIWELFWPLQVGGTVVIAAPGEHRDPRALARTIAAERIAVLHFVPSMLRAFLADAPSREIVGAPSSGVAAAGGRCSVRAVVTSGEALTADLVRGALECFGAHPTNLYGPTEAAVDVTAWECGEADTANGASVPIGRPVWNTSCLVLDARMRPVPIGAVGELWLGGEQLAIGYVGRPELTAERFVETPWGRLYRTGDLASRRPDGALLYYGRTDDQVKVRGQRVELGEIEGVLSGVAGVRGLVAGLAGDRLEEELRRAAETRLPASFVPSRWIPVPGIPLGSSGKADRRRLLAEWPPAAVAEEGEAPRDLLEERTAGILAEVLELPAVPVDASFFDLGGDSLSALRLLGRLEQELGRELGLAEVFAHPTAAGLAARLVDGGDRSDGATDLAEVLTLRAGDGAIPPLFLLPPAGGLGWCYTSLLAGLSRSQPVHVIQAPGLGRGAPEPVADMTALAARQLAAIRGVVGDGAFHVAGWSLGGMAAHAVAALARSEEQCVGAVVLLDAYPAEQWQHLAEPTEAEALVGVLRLGGLDATDPLEAARLDRDAVVERLRRSGSALAALPPALLSGCVESVIEATRIVRTAPPTRLVGGLTVITAAAPRPETHLDADGWRAHVAGEVRIEPIAASHAELVRRPTADRVAGVIAGVIAEARMSDSGPLRATMRGAREAVA
jgi:enterobactin synthetase component F